jgi:hypothetical protein
MVAAWALRAAKPKAAAAMEVLTNLDCIFNLLTSKEE